MLLLSVAFASFFAPGLLAAQATAAPSGSEMPPVVWELVGLTEADGAPVEIAEPPRYTLQFLPEGRVVARLDCNQGSGDYTAADGVLTLTPMAATLKLCLPDSQVDPFQRLLHQITAYQFDPEGFLLLRGEAGELRLQPALTGVLWRWQGIVGSSGEITLQPDHPENYSVTFQVDGKLAIQADCNRAMGVYTVSESGIDLQIRGVTRMLCPTGSLMERFLGDLDQASSYSIDQGTLTLTLPGDAGVMVFAPELVEAADAGPATPATG